MVYNMYNIVNFFIQNYEEMSKGDIFFILQVSWALLVPTLVYLYKLYKKKKKIGRSYLELLEEKTNLVKEIERLNLVISKADDELTIFRSLIPSDTQSRHILIHQLDSVSVFANQIQERARKHVYAEYPIPLIDTFAKKASSVIAKTGLLFDSFSCVRILVSKQILDDYIRMNLIDQSGERIVIDNGYNDFNKEKVNSDSELMDFLFNKFDDSSNLQMLDHILACRCLMSIDKRVPMDLAKRHENFETSIKYIAKKTNFDFYTLSNCKIIANSFPNFISVIILFPDYFGLPSNFIDEDLLNKIIDNRMTHEVFRYSLTANFSKN